MGSRAYSDTDLHVPSDTNRWDMNVYPGLRSSSLSYHGRSPSYPTTRSSSTRVFLSVLSRSGSFTKTIHDPLHLSGGYAAPDPPSTNPRTQVCRTVGDLESSQACRAPHGPMSHYMAPPFPQVRRYDDSRSQRLGPYLTLPRCLFVGPCWFAYSATYRDSSASLANIHYKDWYKHAYRYVPTSVPWRMVIPDPPLTSHRVTANRWLVC